MCPGGSFPDVERPLDALGVAVSMERESGVMVVAGKGV